MSANRRNAVRGEKEKSKRRVQKSQDCEVDSVRECAGHFAVRPQHHSWPLILLSAPTVAEWVTVKVANSYGSRGGGRAGWGSGSSSGR